MSNPAQETALIFKRKLKKTTTSPPLHGATQPKSPVFNSQYPGKKRTNKAQQTNILRKNGSKLPHAQIATQKRIGWTSS